MTKHYTIQHKIKREKGSSISNWISGLQPLSDMKTLMCAHSRYLWLMTINNYSSKSVKLKAEHLRDA